MAEKKRAGKKDKTTQPKKMIVEENFKNIEQAESASKTGQVKAAKKNSSGQKEQAVLPEAEVVGDAITDEGAVGGTPAKAEETKKTAKEKRAEKKALQKAEDKKPKKKNIKARLFVSGIVLVLIASIVVAVLNIRPVGAGDQLVDIIKTPDYLKGKTMNILICGIDDEEGRNNINADLIMLLNIDRENNTAAMLQIPRDTYIGEDIVKYGKINALYQNGYKDGSKKGIAAIADVINTQLKLPVDNYVTITMEGFRKAIDAMGGIEITMTKTIEMDNGIKFEEGETYNLDGVMADKFVRFRGEEGKVTPGYELGDIDRMNVQRYFFAALMDKIFSLSTIEMVSVISSIYKYLETDFTVNEMIQLAKEAKEISKEAINIVRLPGEGVSRYGLYKVDVFTLHRKATADVLNKYMRPHMDPVPETELELIELQRTVDWYDDQGTNLGQYS